MKPIAILLLAVSTTLSPALADGGDCNLSPSSAPRAGVAEGSPAVKPIVARPDLGRSPGSAGIDFKGTALGSGRSGPVSGQFGARVNWQKVDWTKADAAIGELDGLEVFGRQGGPNSDMSGILVDVQNTGLGFLSATEMASNALDLKTRRISHGIDLQEGVVDVRSGDYIGAVYIATHGADSTALQIENSGPGTKWAAIMRNVYNGRTNFVIDAQGNLTTIGGISSGGHDMSAGAAPTAENGTLGATATDRKGTVTERAGATEVLILFHVAYATPPDCIVTSPTGSILRGYRPTTKALIIDNAPAETAEFTYQCIQ